MQALALWALLASSATASAPLGTVTVGDVLFGWYNFGDTFGPFDPRVAGATQLLGSSDVSSDVLGQTWFYWRPSPMEAERALPSPTGAIYEDVPGHFVLQWIAHPELVFDARLDGWVDDPGQLQSSLVLALTLTNTSGLPLSLPVFHYADTSPYTGFGAFPDTAIAVGPSRTRIDDEGTIQFAEYTALGPDAQQTDHFPYLRDFHLLNCCPNDLDGSGLPFGPGNHTGAWQWNLDLAIGASATVITSVSANSLARRLPPELVLSQAVPGVAGQPSRLDVGAGVPGRSVVIVAGTQVGTTAVPGCPGLSVDIQGARVIGSASADPRGNAAVTLIPPASLGGVSVRLQAVDPSTCRGSGLVEQVLL